MAGIRSSVQIYKGKRIGGSATHSTAQYHYQILKELDGSGVGRFQSKARPQQSSESMLFE
jgi:hypothetical protein